MGIDFNGLLRNLAQSSAKIDKDTTKIDTKAELTSYVSGWDAIKNKATELNNDTDVTNDVNIDDLETTMKTELQQVMGADFGKSLKGKDGKEPVFTEDEISLESLTALLGNEDNVDMKKVEKYNKKYDKNVKVQQRALEEVEMLQEFGFDTELTNIIMESEPGAVRYISDAIKNGLATRIAVDTGVTEYAKDAKDLNIIGYMRDAKYQPEFELE